MVPVDAQIGQLCTDSGRLRYTSAAAHSLGGYGRAPLWSRKSRKVSALAVTGQLGMAAPG